MKVSLSWLIVGLALAAVACDSSGTAPSGSSPPQQQIAGTWVGSENGNYYLGSVTFRLTLLQSGTTVSGTWTMTSTKPGPATHSGTVVGTAITDWVCAGCANPPCYSLCDANNRSANTDFRVTLDHDPSDCTWRFDLSGYIHQSDVNTLDARWANGRGDWAPCATTTYLGTVVLRKQ